MQELPVLSVSLRGTTELQLPPRSLLEEAQQVDTHLEGPLRLTRYQLADAVHLPLIPVEDILDVVFLPNQETCTSWVSHHLYPAEL